MEDRSQTNGPAPRDGIRRRLAGWPEALAEPLAGYLSRVLREFSGPEAPDPPDWLATPGWLADAWAEAGPPDGASAAFQADLHWSQTCLFLAIRILDDELDGAEVPEPLAAAPSLLIGDAGRTLRPHFEEHSPLWAFLRHSLMETLSAMIQLDALQREPGAMRSRHLEAYARQSRILDVGAVAVALRLGRGARDLDALQRLLGEVSVVDQILDDLADLDEDLDQGRFTYAANLLLGLAPEPSTPPRHAGASPGAGRGRGDELDRLLVDCRSRLERASRAAAELGVERLEVELAAMDAHLQALLRELHRWRVARAFRAVQRGRPPDCGPRAA